MLLSVSMFALLAAIMYGLLNALFCVRLSYAALLTLDHYRLGQTRIHMLTNHNPQQLPALATMLTAEQAFFEHIFFAA